MASIKHALNEQYTFDQTLLLALDMETIANAAVIYFESLGAKQVKFIWCTSCPNIAHSQSIPKIDLNEIQVSLLEQACIKNQTAEKIIGATHHTVEVLTVTDEHGASLYFEFDALGADPRQHKQWSQALNNLALRCQSMMQKERLLDDLARLANAEKLQRALFAISDLANSDKDSQEVLHEIHQIVGTLMYANNFLIVRYDNIDESMRFIYFVDSVDEDLPDMDKKMYKQDMPNSLTLAMLQLGSPLHGSTMDVINLINLKRDESLGPDSHDWLGVPMLDRGIVVGGIVLQSYDSAYSFSPEDQTLLTYVAQHISIVLLRRDAHEELEKRVNERTGELQREIIVRQRAEHLQQALFRIAEVSQSSVSMDLFYASVHNIIGELLQAKNFYIAFLTADGQSLEFPYFVDERDKVSGTRTLGHGLTEYVIRTGKPVCLNRSDIDKLEQQGEVIVSGAKSISWIGVPLLVAGNVNGVIALQSYSNDYHYKNEDKELVSFVAVHISNALERRLATENLRIANSELEQRVTERTHELANTNIELRDQITVRERIENALKHETMHDALTGLPNRTQLLERLSSALTNYKDDTRKIFAVLFLDLDRFKVVNDSVGHLVGDQLLIQVAKSIGGCIRAPDLIARLGGDEFAILLENILDQEYVIQIANRIIQTLNIPIRIDGKELFTSVSIGIAIANPRYCNPEELLRDADVAMYRAKESGRKRYALFDEGMHEMAINALELENDLNRALSRNEFLPYYQPITQLRDGEIVGFEALIRWQHPQRGLLKPIDFLAVAAESGNLEAIDWQIYEQACKDFHSISTIGNYISLNVSPAHLREKSFANRFLTMLEHYQVETKYIRLEITEGALLEDPDQVHLCLLHLQAMGVHTFLDDFGTGYSSLSYLHRFPLSGIKIDRSFVSALFKDEVGGSSAIVRSICLMAESLGLAVIAEGIETEEQLEQLCALGLTLGQGYYFSRPISVQELCKQYIA
jgi:diguanylate cyclase (GGDEF)-like protein